MASAIDLGLPAKGSVSFLGGLVSAEAVFPLCVLGIFCFGSVLTLEPGEASLLAPKALFIFVIPDGVACSLPAEPGDTFLGVKALFIFVGPFSLALSLLSCNLFRLSAVPAMTAPYPNHLFQHEPIHLAEILTAPA